MRVGGPYQIIVSYVGFVSYDVNNVYLQLGTLKILKVVLTDEKQLKERVVVKGIKIMCFFKKNRCSNSS
jgi:hypothetical protein